MACSFCKALILPSLAGLSQHQRGWGVGTVACRLVCSSLARRASEASFRVRTGDLGSGDRNSVGRDCNYSLSFSLSLARACLRPPKAEKPKGLDSSIEAPGMHRIQGAKRDKELVFALVSALDADSSARGENHPRTLSRARSWECISPKQQRKAFTLYKFCAKGDSGENFQKPLHVSLRIASARCQHDPARGVAHAPHLVS